jgi:hypothetical protein
LSVPATFFIALICADIANATTDWFDQGIRRLSKKLKKQISRDYQDPDTGLYGTIYFGQKFKKKKGVIVATDWCVRGYDKKRSIHDEGDEKLYPQYSSIPALIRIEAVFNSPCFRKRKFELRQCLDRNALFALLESFLCSSDVHFDCVDFIKRT